MKYFIGLGNPTGEYDNTRHNVGRMILESFEKKLGFGGWVLDKKINALVSEGKVGKERVILIMPETYMNNSGKSLKTLITSNKKARDMVVVYDDLDLGLGTFKISFNKNSGGHKGIESIIKTIRTKEFLRLRVGISPITTSTGKVKKPNGEEKVKKHVLGKFTPKEQLVYKKVQKKAVEALEKVVSEGHVGAMNEVNGWKGIK